MNGMLGWGFTGGTGGADGASGRSVCWVAEDEEEDEEDIEVARPCARRTDPVERMNSGISNITRKKANKVFCKKRNNINLVLQNRFQ
jgi:hypothetical protein